MSLQLSIRTKGIKIAEFGLSDKFCQIILDRINVQHCLVLRIMDNVKVKV